MTHWAILTGEYPTQTGGVSDYTALVAKGLVATGDKVSLFAPRTARPFVSQPGVEVVSLSDRFGQTGRAEAMAAFTRSRPDRVLVQYVPHSFGLKAMNLPFVSWLVRKVISIAPLWVMFHEVAFPFKWWPPQHTLISIVNRRMAAQLAVAAERVFVSIPAWRDLLCRFCQKSVKAEWLPVPCTIPFDQADQHIVTQEFPKYKIVGHFGTYSPHITRLLTPVLASILAHNHDVSALLIGRGSLAYRERFLLNFPGYSDRVRALGEVASSQLSAKLRSCDLLIQPFSDGVSSRRTSVMAGLANEVPVVTNLGILSESIWSSRAVAAAPTPDPIVIAEMAITLLSDEIQRKMIGKKGAQLYASTFALEHTIRALRSHG